MTGKFGQGSGFTLTLVASGKQTVDSVSLGAYFPGSGIRYRLYGGSDVNDPLACCPSYVTGADALSS